MKSTKSAIIIGACGILAGTIGLFSEGRKWLAALCIILGVANIVIGWKHREKK